MNRAKTYSCAAAFVAAAALASTACSAGDAKAKEQTSSPPVVQVAAATATQQPIARFIRATGSLMAEEQADVAAETAGRGGGGEIERGAPVPQGAEMVRILGTGAGAPGKKGQGHA